MLDARYLMLDARCLILNTRCSILDTRYSMLDARCLMFDTRCLKIRKSRHRSVYRVSSIQHRVSFSVISFLSITNPIIIAKERLYLLNTNNRLQNDLSPLKSWAADRRRRCPSHADIGCEIDNRWAIRRGWARFPL